MCNLSFLLIYFFILILNNSFLIVTLKGGSRLDLVMRKEKKSKINDNEYYILDIESFFLENSKRL